MNDEKDVAQDQEQTKSEPMGLMAEEAQNIESEEKNAEEEGISHIQNEEAGAEEELGEGEIYERPDWFPEKFWDERDGPNIENMAKSINHLEKKLGETAPDSYDLSEVAVDPDDAVVQAVLEFGKEKQLSKAIEEQNVGKNRQVFLTAERQDKLIKEIKKIDELIQKEEELNKIKNHPDFIELMQDLKSYYQNV